MTEKLDMDKRVVSDANKPTSYLEDVISQLVDSVGGENDFSVPDQIRLANVQTAIVRAQMKANR